MGDKNKKSDSALNVQKGIDQPSQVKPALSTGLKKFRKEKFSIEDLHSINMLYLNSINMLC